MSKNIKTLVCCILALVFVAGTVVAVCADSAVFSLTADEVSTEDVTAEDVSDVVDEDTSDVADEDASDVADEEVSEDVSEEESSEGTTYLMGDVDLNGKVEAADARLALRVAAQLETLSDVQLKLADVNADNRIIAADARSILRVSANLDPAFGVVVL